MQRDLKTQPLSPKTNTQPFSQLVLPMRGFITAFTELLSQTLNFAVLSLKKLFIIKIDAQNLVLY